MIWFKKKFAFKNKAVATKNILSGANLMKVNHYIKPFFIQENVLNLA